MFRQRWRRDAKHCSQRCKLFSYTFNTEPQYVRSKTCRSVEQIQSVFRPALGLASQPARGKPAWALEVPQVLTDNCDLRPRVGHRGCHYWNGVPSSRSHSPCNCCLGRGAAIAVQGILLLYRSATMALQLQTAPVKVLFRRHAGCRRPWQVQELRLGFCFQEPTPRV